MVDGVADKMHERFGESVKNALIEVGVLASKFQGHILATLLGNVANDARETPEELLDRHHADFQNALMKLIKNTGLKCHGVCKFGAQGIAGVLLVKLGKRAIEHGLSDDQDRKSTRLNSSHANISYAVFCLKKKNTKMSKHVINRESIH